MKSRPGWDGSCLLLSEDIRNHIGASLLGSLVQMGIDVGGGADVGVAQEVGDIDQRHLLVQQNAGEGVAQVMIADAAQAQLAEQITGRSSFPSSSVQT